jgi:plasmid stabilization system protein ParE
MGEMDRAVQAISLSPERGPQVEEHTRRYLLRRFPYAVIYRAQAERVLVVAVAHMRRRPGYWRGRH